MNQERIEQAKRLILKSNILSSLEKTEWLQLLPEMNDKQLLELTGILGPKNQALQPAQNLSRVDRVDIYEKELPAPKNVLATTPARQPIQQVQSQPSPSRSESAAPSKTDLAGVPPLPPGLNNPQPQRSASSLAPAAPQVSSRQRPETFDRLPDLNSADRLPPQPYASELKSRLPAQDTVAELKLSFKSVNDFGKLSPGMLHARDPYRVLQTVLNAVAEFAKSRQGIAAIYSVESSPLYKAYIDYGIAMLNQATTQRELSQQEFEAFADFRKELDKLVI